MPHNLYKDETPVHPNYIKQNTIIRDNTKKAAQKAGFYVADTSSWGSLSAVWENPDVTHVVFATHGLKKGIQCIGFVEPPNKLIADEKGRVKSEGYIDVHKVFDPAKAKGKELLVTCCYPHNAFLVKLDAYKNNGGTIGKHRYLNIYGKEFTFQNDQEVDRYKNLRELTKYFNSFKR